MKVKSLSIELGKDIHILFSQVYVIGSPLCITTLQQAREQGLRLIPGSKNWGRKKEGHYMILNTSEEEQNFKFLEI